MFPFRLRYHDLLYLQQYWGYIAFYLHQHLSLSQHWGTIAYYLHQHWGSMHVLLSASVFIRIASCISTMLWKLPNNQIKFIIIINPSGVLFNDISNYSFIKLECSNLIINLYFAFKQLYRNYYWCLQTTRQIKNSRVYNKIEWNFVINFSVWPCIYCWRS